ncbi:leucine-rich repeat protein [Butyrivibrio sp. AD3002]|uniref:leucine-rich repeat protein n=1 Tax=Butyrivibrio sp. AD3002 TaxID=1280670 RepID=UPI0003B302DD|nr:leucine-rich repeat protein [Butyrivibrio sp. AD3002]
MIMKKNNSIRKRVQSVIIAAAIALTIIPGTFAIAKPITAQAATESIVNSLSENERKIYDAYQYLDTRIKEKDVEITAKNKSEFDSAGFYTMYTGAEERVKYSADDLKYARRAYIYSNPLEIAGAMAQIKFLTIKGKDNKYSCYAYLQKTGDNDYTGETKALKKAIKKIMKNIDEDTNFVMELQCFDMVINNTTYAKIAIDNKDLKNTAYGALVQHRASTQGYALAFAALLDELEINNDILFNSYRCWNQIKIGTKWYETDLVACDKSTKGTVDYTCFNTSQKKMKSYGLTRVDYCTKFRESKGSNSTTKSKLQKYSEEMFKDSKNFTLGVLNPDNSVTRTTLLSTEQTVTLVPVFIDNSSMLNCSMILKSLTITTNPEESAFTWTQWTPKTPKITLTKNGPGASRVLSVVMIYDDGTNEGTAISFNVNLVDQDNTTGSFIYKVIDDDNVSLVKCTKKTIKNVNIPSTVAVDGKSYKVSKIEANAFKKCSKLETVMIGANVKEIGANAFSGKTKLIRVETQGYVLNTLGKDAFKSADANTFFLLKATSYSKYNKLVKKVKKAGGSKAVYKFRKY